jgi:hypothetical protein
LFGCYRRADAADPEIYSAAVAAILSEYDEETVAYVTDPRTGIARKSQWLPTIAELDKALAERAAFISGRNKLLSAGWRYTCGGWVKPGDAA